MSESGSSRIVKNTMMLYLRMAVTMFVSLYTSRIVLNALGVSDFGIQNVVGGVIGFFGFIIYSMQTAIQRFLTVSMGKGDIQEVQQVFSIGVLIHVVFSVFILVVGETVGLWFVENKLVIPLERMEAAFWIYQFVIIGTISSLMSIPYTAAVIANEKMSAFAYLSIVNVFLNLGVAGLLLVSPYDRLITYGFLGLCVTLLNQVLYWVYCRWKFEECHFSFAFPRSLLKEITSFAGWDFFGVIAYCVSTQGATIMLNMFFGPAVNAARAIAQTALEKVKSFSSNFTTALNPAISKAYGAGNSEYMFKLMYSGSKMVFFLFFTIMLIAFVKTEYLLTLWLGNVPDYSVQFVQILLVQMVFQTMWNPLFTAGLATGRIKEFGLKTSICNILKMPVCYIMLTQGCSPIVFLVIYTVLEMLSYGIQLFTMKKLIGFDWKDYMLKVQGRGIVIMFLLLPLCMYINSFMEESFFSLTVMAMLSVALSSLLCYYFLLNREERMYCMSKVNVLFGKFIKN